MIRVPDCAREVGLMLLSSERAEISKSHGLEIDSNLALYVNDEENGKERPSELVSIQAFHLLGKQTSNIPCRYQTSNSVCCWAAHSRHHRHAAAGLTIVTMLYCITNNQTFRLITFRQTVSLPTCAAIFLHGLHLPSVDYHGGHNTYISKTAH